MSLAKAGARKKIRQSGFTIVEILIILVTIAVLVTIVANTYAGIKSRSRDTIRRNDILALQNSIEAFYSQNMYYPSLHDLNSPSWRALNLKKLPAADLTDPSWNASNSDCTLSGHSIVLETSVAACYGYHPTNNGISCEHDDTSCNKYTLSATLEQGGSYLKTEL